MGTVVIGGLLVATLLTLFVTRSSTSRPSGWWRGAGARPGRTRAGWRIRRSRAARLWMGVDGTRAKVTVTLSFTQGRQGFARVQRNPVRP